MRMGVHARTLGASLAAADEVWLYAPPDLGWDTHQAVATLGERGHVAADLDGLLQELLARLRSGDQVLIMSNGGFGGLHSRLLTGLQGRHSQGVNGR
jgi:UDP-N-acetylmuramate: L-alanyl-gamma-D-glutamyl-meso-diaminopimelate ligase